MVASNPLNLEPDDPDLRVLAASVNTPQAPNNGLAAATTGTPSATPQGIATPPPNSTPGDRAAPRPTGTPTPAATATKPAGSAPECDNSQSELYCVYTVRAGDTLSGIAAKFALKGNDDVEAWELIMNSNKPDITSEDDLLQIDQKLRIPKGGVALAPATPPPGAPARSGTPPPGSTPAPVQVAARAGNVLHTVLSAETLLDIALKYGVETSDIQAANRSLTDPDKLSIGQELLVPSPKRFAPAAVAVPAPPPSGSGSGSSSASAIISGPRSASGLMWPTTGPVSSYFGPRHPLGIDIDLYANASAPIAASASGTVSFAGGNSCCSYGLYIVIDHGNGLQTLYAHLSKVSVSTGQKVSQGQVIGNGGRTGYATGNHLHFEVHKSGAVVNPVAYLP